jgi:hypothetical protein
LKYDSPRKDPEKAAKFARRAPEKRIEDFKEAIRTDLKDWMFYLYGCRFP